MTREFVWTTAFISGWYRCGFDDENLKDLEYQLIQDPKLGDVIPETGRARKMRFAYEGRGKSGSARVIYVDFEIGEKICGLAVYSKNDKSDLTMDERHAIKKMIDRLTPHYNEKR